MDTKNKNILFITRSSEEGGEAVFIHKLSNFLKSDYSIKTCSLLGNKKQKQENKVFLQPNFLFNKPIITIRSLRILIQEIKKADIVEHFVFGIYSIIFFFICHFFKKRIIITFHTNLNGGRGIRHMYDIVLKFFIINYFIIFTQKAIFLTNAQLNGYRKYCVFKKTFDKKSVVINNFIEKKIIASDKKNINSNILFVGRYTKIKGFNDLMTVAEKNKNVKFSLIGNSDFVSELPNVNNLGKIDHFSILSECDKHSICILPSYTEVFPMVILEAMARGLVILASDIPGMREIIQEGRNGYLFPVGNIKKIEETILFLKENFKEIERISKNNLQDILNFTEEKQVPKYSRAYEFGLNSDKK